MSTLREFMEEKERKEGCTSSHELDFHSNGPEMLSVEWRDGIRRQAFPWSRFSGASMMTEGELVLSFCDYEVVLHGINLGGLWKDLRARRLSRVWELPADYVPPPTLSKHRVCICKIELRESDGHSEASRAGPLKGRREYQTTMVQLRA